MSTSSQNLKYILCPGSQPDPSFYSYYEKIYSCWRDVWTEAFSELNVKKDMYSDAFTRQDYIGAIFHEEQCIAMSFFRWVDANLSTLKDDSYFSNWNESHISSLCSKGKKVIICSYFTVHQNVRRDSLGFSAKDLMCGLLVETFLHSKADCMTGAVRINKGVNSLVERWGATPIAQNIPSNNNALVDLVGFYKDDILKNNFHEYKPIVQNLWHERLVIPQKTEHNKYTEPTRTPTLQVA